MKKLALVVLGLSFSFSAMANVDVVIEKKRVFCHSQSAMNAFMKRKDRTNLVNLPDGCKVTDRKRRGELVKKLPKLGYVEVELKTGNNVYVDRQAIRIDN